jgi:hypothetical protein
MEKTKGNHKRFIGIDTGVNTGYAVWDSEAKEFIMLTTLSIHDAMFFVKDAYALYGGNLFVRVEDARKRRWFGNIGKERLKGAGSVERDAKIWEDFLKDLKVDFEMVHPKNNRTKTSPELFKKITGYRGKCSQHARDAAMLVVGF